MMRDWVLLGDEWFKKSAIQGVKRDSTFVYVMISGEWIATRMASVYYDHVLLCLGINEEDS